MFKTRIKLFCTVHLLNKTVMLQSVCGLCVNLFFDGWMWFQFKLHSGLLRKIDVWRLIKWLLWTIVFTLSLSLPLDEPVRGPCLRGNVWIKLLKGQRLSWGGNLYGPGQSVWPCVSRSFTFPCWNHPPAEHVSYAWHTARPDSSYTHAAGPALSLVATSTQHTHGTGLSVTLWEACIRKGCYYPVVRYLLLQYIWNIGVVLFLVL